jgi:hypothetical protein
MTSPTPPQSTTKGLATKRNASLTLAAFLAIASGWWAANHKDKTPKYDPAKDTTLVFIGKDKLGKKCEDPKDTMNPATCAWVVPDSNGYAKKVVPMNDEMWAARDTMMRERFDRWFAKHGHTDSIRLEGVLTDKYTAKAVMDSVYQKEGHYPTVTDTIR